MHEGHHVLQLIPESVGASGLIEPGPPPEPAAHVLIEQPAVGHDIDRGIGGVHIHRPEGAVPPGPDAFQRGAVGIDAAEAVDQLLHLRGVPADPEAEADFALRAIGQVKRHLQRPAGIHARSDLAREPRAQHGRRHREAAIPAQEFLPVPGDSTGRVVHVEEHDPVRELGVVIIAGQQRPRLQIHLGLHMQQAFLPQVGEDPLPVSCDRQAARPPRNIAQLQHREFDCRIHRHIHPQFRDDPVPGVFENRITKTVADHIRHLPPGWQRRGRPELPGLLIADIKGFTGSILHRIIAPGREPELMRILQPGVGRAAFGDDRSEGWIGQHIHPRGRGHLTGLQGDDIFVAVPGETAQPIGKNQFT